MKSKNVYFLLFLLSILMFNSCGKDKVEDILADESDLGSYYEDVGRIDMTVNGQEIKEPLVGVLAVHPSTADNTFGNTFQLLTWNFDAWLRAVVLEELPPNHKFEGVHFLISREYNGEGRYELANNNNLACYWFGIYNRESEQLEDDDNFCSNTMGNDNSNGFIEITSEENGRVRGNFSTQLTSEDTGNQIQIEGTFDVKI